MRSAPLNRGPCLSRAVVLQCCLVVVLATTIAATETDGSSCSDITQHVNWPLMNVAGCGRGSAGAALSSRIYNGETAALGEYPWLARLMIRDANGTVSGGCGGSIITNRYVLTAAHCCISNFTLAHVTVGEHDARTDVDCQGGFCAPPAINVTVESFLAHPGFDIKQPSFDICLVRLSETLVFTDFVRPACLPFDCKDQEGDLDGTKLEIAGFGLMSNFTTGFKTASVLQKSKQEVVPLDVCRQIWKGVFNVTDAEICTLGNPKESQACHGDSGGPLMALSSSDKEPILVGIISHGWTCFLSVYYGAVPAVNVKVSAYLPWILDTVSP